MNLWCPSLRFALQWCGALSLTPCPQWAHLETSPFMTGTKDLVLVAFELNTSIQVYSSERSRTVLSRSSTAPALWGANAHMIEISGRNCLGAHTAGKSHPWTNASVGGKFRRTFRTIGSYEFPQEKVWTNDWSIWMCPEISMDQWHSKFSESFSLDRHWPIPCAHTHTHMHF